MFRIAKTGNSDGGTEEVQDWLSVWKNFFGIFHFLKIKSNHRNTQKNISPGRDRVFDWYFFLYHSVLLMC